MSELHSQLEAALRAIAPELRVEVARDVLDIRRSEDFNERIRVLLREARVLLCVLSANYTHSTYCSAEIEFFIQRGNMRRLKLMKVGKEFVQVSRQPDALQNLLGHKFHADKRPYATLPTIIENGRPHPRFEQAVGALAREVAQAVEGSRAQSQPVLVLTNADREDEARAIINDLEAAGIDVVSRATLPKSQKDRRDLLKRYIRQVDFALLLLGHQYSDELVTAFGQLEEKWDGAKARHCLCAMPATPPPDPLQADFLARVRNSGDAFDYAERPDEVLPETLRLYRALAEQANQVPTLYLTYPKSSRPRAERLRDEIRLAHESLGINVPIRVLDPYGDGDSPMTRTQTQARDMSLRQAHGAVVLIEEAGHYVQTVVGEIEDELTKPATPYIAIYPGGPNAKVEPALARKYRVIVPDQGPGFDWLKGDARTIQLSKFLRDVQARATSA